MPVKRSPGQYKLRGKRIRSLDEFYDEISGRLNFPDHFGRNLDALWDVLTTDIGGPVELVWENSSTSRSSMGKDFEKISVLLRDVEKERHDFHVIFR
jgi:ribonuclease inhibitor